ncbi:MFS transporter [Streptomyces sp. RKND-216]|uniref:MFS transporter n=1 Tax=Streptomyces sp. RKND-216 TaxID=2562581 RepID=UPI00109DD301|nr:MFS transporter [Streptomyces sp. RKND-216]THA26893.1 MFS transporter [Streptomyces sp. RKND-216]
MNLGRARSAGLLHVTDHAEHRGTGERPGPRDVPPAAVLTTGCAALFLLGVNTTAINAALPAIAGDLDIGATALGWAVGIYMLVVAALVVVGGRLGDMLGQRTVLTAGLLVFAVGAVLVAVCTATPLLLVGRFVQGVGAALMMPGTMAVLRLAYPPERQGFAQGVWGAVAGIAFAVGPLIGGVLTDELSWRWVWWGSALWALLVTVVGQYALRGLPGREPWTGLDVPGALLLAVALPALVLAFQQIPVWGAGSPAVVAAFVVAAVGLVALVAVESRRRSPLLHLRLLREPAVIAACLGTCVNALFLIGLLYFFNLYAQAQAALDYSALLASAALLPYGACVFAASLLIGRLCDRVGFRLPVAGGLVCAAVGALLLARTDAATGYAELWPATAVLGIGVGITLSSPSGAGLRALPPQHAGEGAGIINVVRYLAAALVVSIGTLVFLSTGAARLNARLAEAGVPPRDDARVDRLLTGVGERLSVVEQGLGPAARQAVREGAAAGIAHGFAMVMLWLGVLTLLSIPAWLLLVRTPSRR